MTGNTCTLRFLTGPTACGKSETGALLAEKIGAEIISLDSMAIYRGMDIGTAKPTAAQKERVPHHLIDIVEPRQSYSVADYVRDAEEAARDIIARGAQVLFVGGTGLYLKRFVEGIFSGPRADATLREQYRERAICEGLETLHEELRSLDPESAGRIHENDARRIIRALEVRRITGRPMSALQREGREKFERTRRSLFGVEAINYKMCAMVRDREDLNRRIGSRVDEMFAAGLVDEVRALCPEGAKNPLGRQASQALGYKEALAHLNGSMSLDEALENTKLHTRQFATRQMTWFRNFPSMRYAEIYPDEEADLALGKVEHTLAGAVNNES